jgi:hypothetical protein
MCPSDTDESLDALRLRLQQESSDGLRLLENVRDNPVCSIEVDASIPGLVVVWKRYATSTQLRYIHECILSLLKQHGLQKILGVDTKLPLIHDEDQKWIVDNWMPRALAAGLRAGASTRPASLFGRISVAEVQSHLPGSLLIRSFDSVGEARSWLETL